MAVSVQLGLLCALACSLVGLVGFLLKQRGAVAVEAVRWRHPVRSAVALFRNRSWTLGILVAQGAWTFHVAALALAPISLVQSVIAGGLALLTVIADRLFDIPVSRREWVGVALAGLGLGALAATLGDTGSSAHGAWETGPLALYVGVLALGSLACCAAVLGDPPRSGLVLAVAAGLMWAASDVAIKALSDRLGSEGPLVVLHPLAAVIAVLSLAGLVVSARSLQLGAAVPVIATTNVAVNLATIASGPIVFSEPLPEGPLAMALRIAAVVLICAAAALTPGPIRREPRPAT